MPTPPIPAQPAAQPRRACSAASTERRHLGQRAERGCSSTGAPAPGAPPRSRRRRRERRPRGAQRPRRPGLRRGGPGDRGRRPANTLAVAQSQPLQATTLASAAHRQRGAAPPARVTATVPAVISGEPGQAIQQPARPRRAPRPGSRRSGSGRCALAVVAAALLIGSFVLSRLARSSAGAERGPSAEPASHRRGTGSSRSAAPAIPAGGARPSQASSAIRVRRAAHDDRRPAPSPATRPVGSGGTTTSPSHSRPSPAPFAHRHAVAERQRERARIDPAQPVARRPPGCRAGRATGAPPAGRGYRPALCSPRLTPPDPGAADPAPRRRAPGAR